MIENARLSNATLGFALSANVCFDGLQRRERSRHWMSGWAARDGGVTEYRGWCTKAELSVSAPKSGKQLKWNVRSNRVLG